jgi:hypothetical protein
VTEPLGAVTAKGVARWRRRLSLALLLLLALDLLVVIVTGGASPLALGRLPVGMSGFALRALAVGCLFVLRFRVLAMPERRVGRGRMILGLLLLPTLFQFQFGGGRINGDGLMYYPYVRSLWKDFDLDFTNEYTHFGLITRGDLRNPTKTGLRRSIFSIGPGLVWTPFFWVGEGVARVEDLVGGPADLSGYGPTHRNAVALGSLLYGFAAVLLIHSLLLRHFDRRVAFGASLLTWGATNLHWYMVQQPTMSHAPSAFAAALVIWLWDRDRSRRGLWGYALLGLSMGVAMCVRWQNGVLLVLPGLELLRSLWQEPRRLSGWAAGGACLLAGAAVGAFPQMAAWKVLYDEWILRYPPHGADFMRFDHPYILNTLFSSRHGLLSWTPILWGGFLGFLPLVRRRRALALPLLVPLVLMTYVNMCSGDWWAGGSFSNRRFDSLLPVLAIGLAAFVEVAWAALRARPEAALGLAAVPFVLWNVTLAEQVRRGLIPRDDTVSFPRLVENGWRVMAEAVGSPPTWPASWIFAWRHERPPSQYDGLVGRYLFYMHNNMRGHIEIGDGADEAMLGEGWSRIETLGEAGVRRALRRARLFAPLDQPVDLSIRVRAAAALPRTVTVSVNGHPAGRFLATSNLEVHEVAAAARFWRREINEVELTSDGDDLQVDYVAFQRIGGRS